VTFGIVQLLALRARDRAPPREFLRLQWEIDLDEMVVLVRREVLLRAPDVEGRSGDGAPRARSRVARRRRSRARRVLDRDGAGRIRDPPRYARRPLEASRRRRRRPCDHDPGGRDTPTPRSRYRPARASTSSSVNSDTLRSRRRPATSTNRRSYGEVAHLAGTLLDGAPDDRALAVGGDRENEPQCKRVPARPGTLVELRLSRRGDGI
jgi:hypothetical protein